MYRNFFNNVSIASFSKSNLTKRLIINETINDIGIEKIKYVKFTSNCAPMKFKSSARFTYEYSKILALSICSSKKNR